MGPKWLITIIFLGQGQIEAGSITYGWAKIKIAMGQDLPSFEPDNVQLKFGEISLENDTFDKNISLILGIKGSAV